MTPETANYFDDDKAAANTDTSKVGPSRAFILRPILRAGLLASAIRRGSQGICKRRCEGSD